jgi:hypothetical protein
MPTDDDAPQAMPTPEPAIIPILASSPTPTEGKEKKWSLTSLLERLIKSEKKIEVVIDDSDVLITEPFGWGMHRIDKIKFKADITAVDFESESQCDIESQIDTLFSATVSVFRDEREGIALPAAAMVKIARGYAERFLTLGLIAMVLLALAFTIIYHLYGLIVPVVFMAAASFVTFGCCMLLINRFKTDGLWPGLMEERLQEMTECRFPKADSDVRRVLNHLTTLFLDNNWSYVRIKRRLQMWAIVSFYMATVPIIAILRINGGYLADPAVSMLGIIWILLWIASGLITFYVLNEEVFRDKYSQTLQMSAQNVSTMMVNRINSLTMLFQHYYNHINTIQSTGQGLEGGKSITEVPKHDHPLRNYEAFHCTQIMLWIAERMAYLEWHMLHRMHSAQTVHAVLNIVGFIAATAICMIGVTPMIAFLAYVNTGIDFSIPVLGKSMSMVAVINALGGFTILLTVVVSWISYANSEWNSGRTILLDHFKSNNLEGWHTVAKLRYDEALAGRVQRAMFQIKYGADLLAGRKGG